MDINTQELDLVKQAERDMTDLAAEELSELQLALIGGGCGGNVIFA